MTTICGMTGTEITMLQRWANLMRLPVVPITDDEPFADVYHLRKAWMRSGGMFPVTEAQVVFLNAQTLEGDRS